MDLNLKQKLRYPTLIPRSLATVVNKNLNQPKERYNTNGCDIFCEDWDNLIILDACRYDYFEEYYEQVGLNGKLESRISRGSTSREWARGNFHGEDKFDSIYISHNSWPQKIRRELGENHRSLYHVEIIQDNYREKGHMRDACDKLFSRSLELQAEYPNKRLIIHYIQPHRPYVDANGDIILDYKHTSVTELKRNGVSRGDFRDAYRTTVIHILNHIKGLLGELMGKTIISADHGELLGDRMSPIPYPSYGHPEGVYTEDLVKVPWFIVDYEMRREIRTACGPLESGHTPEMDDEELNQHLRYLGYKL